VSGEAPALHLVDPDGPGASRWLCALARTFAGAPIMVLGSRAAPWARARVPVPGGSPALAARALERWGDAWGVEGVVAWGSRAAEVAVRARDAAERMLVLDDAPASGAVAFDAELVCVGDACADRVCAKGWPPMRARVLQPPVPLMVEPDADGARRRAWRDARAIRDATLLVGLLPAAPGAGDAWSALQAVGRVRMAGLDAALVLDTSTAQAGSAQVLARSIGMRDSVHFADLGMNLADVAPAIDAWISLPGTGRDGTALDPTVAAGAFAPVLAQEGSSAAALIDRGVDGLVAQPPNGLAARLIELFEHTDRRRDLAVAARVRHASASRREAFAGTIQAFEARASMRAASASAASK
jgi:hypothetical protein